MVKTWHQGPCKPTHHPCPCLPYKAPGDLLRGNRRITFHSPCVTHILHHTSRSPTSRQLFSSWYHKPLDVIAPPQVPKGFPGNATATYCNRGQQSMDLSPSGGRPQRLQCLGKFWVAGNLSLLAEPFNLQSVSSFIQRGYVFGLFWPV